MARQNTRLQILDSALDQFWQASYQAVNMNDLSRIAGVNKATVYQHFASKEELAVAAVARAAERTVEYAFEGAFAAFTDPRERLSEIYQRIYQTHKSVFDEGGTCVGCPFVNIGVEMATASEPIRMAVNAAFARFRPFYVAIVEDLKQAGALARDAGTETIADDLLANMNASLVAAKLQNDPEVIFEGLARARDMVRA